MLIYLMKATEKTFLYWIQAEPNHGALVINEIKSFIVNKKTKTIKEWDQLIKEEEVTRLFKYN